MMKSETPLFLLNSMTAQLMYILHAENMICEQQVAPVMRQTQLANCVKLTTWLDDVNAATKTQHSSF